jgi:hypothetical protein
MTETTAAVALILAVPLLAQVQVQVMLFVLTMTGVPAYMLAKVVHSSEVVVVIVF